VYSEFWRQVGIPRRRWKYNIKMDVKELGNISLVQHRDEGLKVPDLRFIQMAGYLLIGDLLSVSWVAICYMELVI